MWITPGRVLYAGLLGRPGTRRLGGWIVYFADETPLRLTTEASAAPEASWPQGVLAVVPPYQPHRVTSQARMLSNLILEPESFDAAALPPVLAPMLCGSGGVFDDTEVDALALRARLRQARNDALDRLVFGEPLKARAIDPRIERILAELGASGAEPRSADALSADVGLSVSRFVHLFKQETGVSLRTYRAWKRARSVLHLVTRPGSLTELAFTTGYPDSAHFSRSIRQVFGLQPREVMAGSRRIALLAAPDNQ
jgi:AraC-like DNA-binding protein